MNPVFVFVVLILFLVCFTKFVLQPYNASRYAIMAVSSPVHEERLTYAKKALQTSPLGKYQVRGFIAEGVLALAGNRTRRKASERELLEEVSFIAQELEKTVQESPLDYRSLLNLGQIYNLWGGYDESKISRASEILEQAIRISPTNQKAYWSLIQTRINQQRFEEALSLAKKAWSLEPRVEQANYILIEVAKMAGKKDVAMEAAKKAVEIDPSWKEKVEKILERSVD